MLRLLVVTTACAVASLATAQAPSTWTQATTPPQPAPRSHAALATDLAHGEVLLFGGWDALGSTLGDTWIWNETGWRRRWSGQAPPPRRGHSLAYDSARQRVVLFGGQLGGVYYRDTWEWDGVDWQLRATAGPSPRTTTAMAYDAARQRTVLFGGLLPTVHDAETWEWDGTTWTQRLPSVAPPARGSHAMAYDTSNQRVVLFGGQGAQVQMDDTWLWDGTQWSPGPLGPQARWGHAMAFDPTRNRVLLAGGRNQAGMMPDVVWEWGGANWVARPHLFGHWGYGCALAFDPLLQQPMLFGQKNVTAVGGRGHWDAVLQEWTFLDAGSGPRDLYDPRLVSVDARQRLVAVAYQQQGTTGLVRRITTEWDGAVWHLRNYGATPPAVALASELSGRSILFGGTTQNETWGWDGNGWQQLPTAIAPPARTATAMVLDPLRQRIVLFGGLDAGGGLRQDTWEWDGLQWLLRAPVVAPPARKEHALAFDENRGAVVLFGGSATGPNPLGDTWQWDGSQWTQLAFATQPPARARGSMAFDRARQRLVLAGGRVTVPYPLQPYDLSDSWELGLAGWAQGGPLPAATASGLAAWDPARQAVLHLPLEGNPWFGGNATATTQSPLGSGCTGSVGIPVLTCSQPALGAVNASISLANVAPYSICVTGWSLGSTPIPLGGGCTVWIDGSGAISAVLADALGRTEQPLWIPLDPTLRGLPFYVQGAALDGGSAIGLALTGAIALSVGD